MKRCVLLIFALCCVVACSWTTLFAETSHYINGIEGIKAGTVPPPGVYYRMYNVFYNADKLMDNDGNDMPVDFKVSVYAMANRFIWVTNQKILGADFFMDATIPLVNTNFKLGVRDLDQHEFGLGDICVEPVGLAWHGPRYDASFALAVYMPTGKYDKNDFSSPGMDFWTYMTTLGGTLYLDDSKTWSASILARYEINSEKKDTDVTPGNDFHFEWGIGKSFAKIWEAGLTGYCQWQVTDDSGSDAVNTDKRDRVYAAGPEISVFIPPIMSAVSLRSQWEFGAEDRSEGNITTLTFTKIF